MKYILSWGLIMKNKYIKYWDIEVLGYWGVHDDVL